MPAGTTNETQDNDMKHDDDQDNDDDGVNADDLRARETRDNDGGPTTR